MGNYLQKTHTDTDSTMDTTESEPNTPCLTTENGLIFNGILIPEEIVSLIISHVDCETLNLCRRVCQIWRSLASEAFRLKALREYPEIRHLKRNAVPSYVYENIVASNAYDINLLKNDSGQEGLKHWNILRNGGSHWKAEIPPVGLSESVDRNEPQYSPEACFASSYQLCSKEQRVNLYKAGLSQKIINQYQPDITISELYGARFDCVSQYSLLVVLLNAKKEVVKDFSYSADLASGDHWKKVSHTFSRYGSGVKYVLFRHEGKDSQFWAGHYGAKMAKATVSVSKTSIFQNLAAEPPVESNAASVDTP